MLPKVFDWLVFDGGVLHSNRALKDAHALRPWSNTASMSSAAQSESCIKSVNDPKNTGGDHNEPS